MTQPVAPDSGHAGPPGEIKAVPVRHPGRWVAAVVVLVLASPRHERTRSFLSRLL